MTGYGPPGEQPGHSQPYAGPPPTAPPAPLPPGAQPQYVPMYAPNPYLQQAPFVPLRPAQATAAAVLGHVCAGLLILAGTFLLFGASIAYDADLHHHRFSGELTVDGFANMLAAGLLIAGGVTMCGRNANGRVMYTIATLIVVAESVYWIARLGDPTGGAVIVWAMVYGTLVIIGVCLAWSGGVSAWLRGE